MQGKVGMGVCFRLKQLSGVPSGEVLKDEGLIKQKHIRAEKAEPVKPRGGYLLSLWVDPGVGCGYPWGRILEPSSLWPVLSWQP